MKKLLAATLLGTTAMIASAQGGAPARDPAPAGVLSLSAQAATDVPTDVVHLTLAAEQEGAEPGTISSALSTKAQQVIA